MNESGAADLTPPPNWNITDDPTSTVEEYGVAIIKVGHVEDHIDLVYVSAEYASALISGASMHGWEIQPVNFGYRVILPDDGEYKFADLIDRKQAFDEAGIVL